MIPKEPHDLIGHADGAVRFLGERLVVINDDTKIAPWYGERLRSILRRAKLEWVVLPHRPEDAVHDDIPSAVGCYANFLMVRGLVIVPCYKRDEDDAALRIIEANTSGMAVVPLDCTGLARGGGVLNCVTWTFVRDSSPSQASSLQGKSTRMTIKVRAEQNPPEVACPICGDILRPSPEQAVAPKTWLDCLRRCPRCELGYSNARANPTTLFGRPEMNVPEPVRDGVLAALDSAFNVRNRPNKKTKFGYSTSEDALTWTVFRHLVHSAQLTNALHRAGLPIPDDATHPEAVLLWGVPIPTDRADDERGRKLRGDLEAIANRLRENPRSRTEPDVVIDFGPKGLIIIEVKHRSGTDIKQADYSGWDRYYPSDSPLAYGNRLRTSGCYELARNWRFGLELTNAPPRPFTLACLGPDDLFRGMGAEVLRPFEACLPAAGAARFHTVGWNTLLGAIQDMPDWLVRYVKARGYSTPE